MNEPEVELEPIFQNIATAYLQEYASNLAEIKTFETIFKDKKHSKEIRDLAKEILTELYKQRDENGSKAEFYRALHKNPHECKRLPGWRKS